MTIGETIAAAGAGITVLGWFATWALQSIRDGRNTKLQKLIDYTEQQLQELYGPLLTLVIEGQQAWEECARSLDRTPEDLARELSAKRGPGVPFPLRNDEIDTWVFWVEHAFFPRNDKIEQLLATKAHLIERVRHNGPKDPVFPMAYRKFLEHHNNWKMRHMLWREQHAPYSMSWTVPWPPDFDERVEKAFQALKERHESFLVEQREETWRSVHRDLPDVALANGPAAASRLESKVDGVGKGSSTPDSQDRSAARKSPALAR